MGPWHEEEVGDLGLTLCSRIRSLGSYFSNNATMGLWAVLPLSQDIHTQPHIFSLLKVFTRVQSRAPIGTELNEVSWCECTCVSPQSYRSPLG